MPTLTIEDRTATGKPVSSISVPDLPQRITLRELIRLRVREEVARHNMRPAAEFVGLVQPEGSHQTASGFRLSRPRRIDWERQAQVALDSFQRNGFFVLVNGEQVVDVDAELDLSESLDVGFVKLTPLVGG
jgi:hypothetical protein